MVLDTDVICHETSAQILANKGSRVWSIGPDASVFEAIHLMDEVGAGALLVLAGGRLVGMISERDFMPAKSSSRAGRAATPLECRKS